MLLHEHLNYFDEDSLARVLRAAGFEPLLLETARHGGVLLCCAVPAASPTVPTEPAKKRSKFQNFCTKAQAALHRFAELACRSGQSELGLYVPLRAFPYLAQIPPDETRLRFFDDDPGLRSCYYDGFDIPIENQDDLAARSPGQLIVCSLSFGNKIASRLRERGIGELRVVMWSELFDEIAR